MAAKWDVDVGPIWDDSHAEEVADMYTFAHPHLQWTKEWRTTVWNNMSTITVKERIDKYSPFDVSVGLLWNQLDAETCASMYMTVHPNLEWTRKWRTTVPNEMSVLNVRFLRETEKQASGGKVPRGTITIDRSPHQQPASGWRRFWHIVVQFGHWIPVVGSAFTITDGIIELREGHTEEGIWHIAEGLIGMLLDVVTISYGGPVLDRLGEALAYSAGTVVIQGLLREATEFVTDAALEKAATVICRTGLTATESSLRGLLQGMARGDMAAVQRTINAMISGFPTLNSRRTVNVWWKTRS